MTIATRRPHRVSVEPGHLTSSRYCVRIRIFEATRLPRDTDHRPSAGSAPWSRAVTVRPKRCGAPSAPLPWRWEGRHHVEGRAHGKDTESTKITHGQSDASRRRLRAGAAQRAGTTQRPFHRDHRTASLLPIGHRVGHRRGHQDERPREGARCPGEQSNEEMADGRGVGRGADSSRGARDEGTTAKKENPGVSQVDHHVVRRARERHRRSPHPGRRRRWWSGHHPHLYPAMFRGDDRATR